MTDPDPIAAVAAGGPMDGEVLGPAGAPIFEVVMADLSRWVYRATTEWCTAPDGAVALVYRCRGRT